LSELQTEILEKTCTDEVWQFYPVLLYIAQLLAANVSVLASNPPQSSVESTERLVYLLPRAPTEIPGKLARA
jgi:hypothetical protein